MTGLPVRGERVRDLDLELPPRRGQQSGRPLKRWRYVGVYGPELMLCVGDARVGPVPQRWWAVALPDGTLFDRTTTGRGGVEMEGSRVRVRAGLPPRPNPGNGWRPARPGALELDLELDEGDGVEVVSRHGRGHIWTRKQALVPVRGRLSLGGASEQPIDGVAFIDDSAGYHARHTAWRWSAGNGRLEDGRAVAWNLVTGVHDAPRESERTLWLGGEARELGPVRFADDLSSVSFDEGGTLEFSEWSTREDNTNLLLFRSAYRQPFGTFAGELPGGLRLAEGFGVMEVHDVRW